MRAACLGLQLALVALLAAVASRAGATAEDAPTPLFPAPVEEEHWGYIDQQGRLVIEPSFTTAAAFSEGLALVQVGGYYGYIDSAGQYVIPPQFQEARDFSEGVAFVISRDGTQGYIDKTGQRVIELKNAEPAPGYFQYFSNGRAWVEIRNQTGGGFTNRCIDRTGRTIFTRPPGDTVYPFKEGLSQIASAASGTVYVDVSGKVAVDLDDTLHHRLSYGRDFSEGLAEVVFGGTVNLGYVDTRGIVVIAPSSKLSILDFGWSRFSEGLAAVDVGSIDAMCGYIDRSGTTVIPGKFDSCRPFSGGLAAVKVGGDVNSDEGVWGFIDRAGVFVIKPMFGALMCLDDDACQFSTGLAKVAGTEQDGSETFGYIDRTGQYVWKSQLAESEESEDIE